MALVQVQPPRRNYPGVTQQQSMWLLTTLALVQVQPPGPRPTVAQQQSKWLLPTRALVQVQLVGLFDLKLSGCSSGGERLLGMQEAAGAIPVFQTQIDSRARSFTATAPRWNAELLTPAAEVRVLSVVRLPPLLGWNATLRTLLAGVQLLSVALVCYQSAGAAAC